MGLDINLQYFDKFLGFFIRKLRKVSKLNQSALAHLLSLSTQQICRYENGDSSITCSDFFSISFIILRKMNFNFIARLFDNYSSINNYCRVALDESCSDESWDERSSSVILSTVNYINGVNFDDNFEKNIIFFLFKYLKKYFERNNHDTIILCHLLDILASMPGPIKSEITIELEGILSSIRELSSH